MRAPPFPLLVASIVASIVIAPRASAQFDRQRTAFERAVTPWLGLRSFGHRVSGIDGRYRYKSSLSLGARFDQPLTRRTGLMLDLSVAPITGQEGDIRGGSTTLNDDLMVFGADLGIAGRLKPAVPVFFYVGGGVLRATKYALPQADGAPVEPQATVAIGYDATRHDRWNFRALYAMHLVRPADPGLADASAESTALDWELQLGARYTFGRAAGSAR